MSQEDRHSTGGKHLDDRESQWTQAAQRHYDGEFELSTEIVYTIAEAKGVSPTEVRSPPLYECVDAACLENAFFGESAGGDSPRTNGSVQFTYAEFLVNVGNDGWIQVYEPDDR
ncbi:HalOD1 output domain-containing protein [Halomicroarcula sp. GCM10025324]|uniref:HalOD1 output domain-containing protein n=1 Tax=Haloarcula TaxID=2237 RepID=UPI0023E89A85|nr:HalOD1 output domain-containing protein [Halomicroarcula sp. ZS-22-S1]